MLAYFLIFAKFFSIKTGRINDEKTILTSNKISEPDRSGGDERARTSDLNNVNVAL